MEWKGILQYKLVDKLVVPVNDIVEWAKWFEKANRHVGITSVGPLTVSTVFLGIDHGWGKKSKFFETMIFGDQDQLVDFGNDHKRLISSDLDYQERYETWAEAEEGHKRACQWARDYLDKLNLTLSQKESWDANAQE